jgi:hypothetical protein
MRISDQKHFNVLGEGLDMLKKLVMATALAGMAVSAHALTITFEDVSGVTYGTTSAYNNSTALTATGYTYDGFTWSTTSSLRVYSEGRAITDTFYDASTSTTMTTTTGLGAVMAAYGDTATSSETSGTWVAVLENNNSSLTFTNTSFADASSGFYLSSLYLYDGKTSKTTVTITGTLLDGTTVAVTTTVSAGTGTTYSLSGTALDGVALTAVTVTTTQGKLAIDNIVVTAANTVTAVPEPSSYAMLLAGLGMVGFMVRRRSVR